MSASDEEVVEFLQRGAELVPNMAGSILGATLGAALGGPVGAVVGATLAPFASHQLKRLAGEFVTRQMGDRQRVRAGAGALLLTDAINRHLKNGEALRTEDFQAFDDSERNQADEIAERAIIDMIAAVDERNLQYIANLYASLYFDKEINITSVHGVAKMASGLNYRSLCILNIIGGKKLYTGVSREDAPSSTWSVLDHIVANETYALISSGILVLQERGSKDFGTSLGYMDLEIGVLKLSELGKIFYVKMELGGMPAADETLVETEASLRRIAIAPSGTISAPLPAIIDGGTV